MNRRFLRALACTLVAAFPLAGQDLVGVDFNTAQLWRVDSMNGAVTRLGTGSVPSHNGMALVGSTYWASAVGSTDGLSVIDPAQGTSTLVFAPTSQFRCLAGMGTLLLGIRTAATTTGGELVSIDTRTGAEKLIGPTGLNGMTALTMHNGTLYGWDVALGLVTVDLATGVATDVNPFVGNPACCIGAPIQYLTSHPDGRLLGGRTLFFSIDPITGVATLLGTSSPADLRGAELLRPGANLPTPKVCAGANGPIGISVLSFIRNLTTVSFPHTPGVGGYLLIGASRTAYQGTPLPIPLGFLGSNCLLNVSPDITVFGRATAAGSLTISLPLPLLPAPVPVFVQHLALEPVTGGIATTISLPLIVQS